MFLSTVVVVLVVSLTSIVNCEDADCNNDDEVNLSLVGKDICPSQSVTVRCVVKKPSNQQSPFLSWRCSGSVNENLVICNPILDFNCEFGKVVNVTGSCKCEDTVIVSEATFIPNTDSAGNLTCGNGRQEKTISVYVELKTPVLNYTELSVDGDVRNVRVNWRTPDNTTSGIEYVLSINNSTEPVSSMLLEKKFLAGIRYELTVVSQLCQGNLQSNSSNKVFIFFPVVEPNAPGSSKPGVKPKAAGSSTPVPVGGIVGGITAPVVVLIATTIVVAVVIYIGKHYIKLQSRERGIFTFDNQKFPGEELTEAEKSAFKREDIENGKTTGVGALYVDNPYIYYSTYESCEGGKRFTLQKYCKQSKRRMATVVGFDRVRGIGKDNTYNLYVVDSSNWRVLKFDTNLIPQRKTCSTAKVIQEPYGILVTDKYIVVCGHEENKISIFHDNLDLCCHINPKNILISPTDITVLDGIYFVTAYAAIVAITIDFDKQTFDALKIGCMIENRKFQQFSVEIQLRGICAGDKYLYVTETTGRLLCLKYDKEKKKLHYISSMQCSPINVAHHNGTVYFSRKTSQGDYYIAKVTEDYGGMGYEDLFKV